MSDLLTDGNCSIVSINYVCKEYERRPVYNMDQIWKNLRPLSFNEIIWQVDLSKPEREEEEMLGLKLFQA